jgi:FlaA1/EpsC-like NDP-sugar epimerase
MSPSFRSLVFQRAARVFDLAVVSLTFVAALAISPGYFSWLTLAEFLAIRIKVENMLIFGGYLLLCSVIFSKCGFYSSHRLCAWLQRAIEILVATILITIVLSLLPRQMLFATTEFLLVFGLLNFCVLSVTRLIAYCVLSFARSQSRNFRNIVIVGEGEDATAFAERIAKDGTLGYRVLRVIKAEEDRDGGAYDYRRA